MGTQNTPRNAARSFQSAVEAMGFAQVGNYVNARTPIELRCSEGHVFTRRPNHIQQRPNATACPGCASDAAPFLSAAVKQQFTLIGAYVNRSTPVRIVCRNGHLTEVRPSSVLRGQGPCRFCFVRHDVLYIVTGPDGVKFGVTSGDPADRLSVHRRNGYPTVERLWTGLPEDVAYQSEAFLLRAVRDAGFVPVQGREYFAPEALPTILRLADGLSLR